MLYLNQADRVIRILTVQYDPDDISITGEFSHMLLNLYLTMQRKQYSVLESYFFQIVVKSYNT